MRLSPGGWLPSVAKPYQITVGFVPRTPMAFYVSKSRWVDSRIMEYGANECKLQATCSTHSYLAD